MREEKNIMKNLTYIQLKKNSKKEETEYKIYKLVLMGDCATQLLATAIKGYGYEYKYNIDILDVDYDQIDSQVMNVKSELYNFSPASILIFMCSEKLYDLFCNTPIYQREMFADITCNRIINYWSFINKNIKANIIQFTFINQNDMIFGDYAYKTKDSFYYQLHKLNYLLIENCQKVKNVYLIDLNRLSLAIGKEKFFDEKLYYIAKMPIAMEALPMVAKSVLDRINTLNGNIKKCVIIDLDNTIWGGVIGDDGLEGIQIGNLGIGHAFTEFQKWLKELKNRGIILAVCSKNNEDVAKQPFINHPDMILHLDDISMFVANWEDKASNIKFIQETLNIGMDSIVFFDDNQFERALVSTLIPTITVPNLPEDPALYLSYIKKMNLFETASYSNADHERTDQYRAEANRAILQKKIVSIDDYLKGLEMVATADRFEKFYFPRIAQLTQRSNQFNLRTLRYTEADIENIVRDDNHITLYFCLKDKFGDYGLVSVVILDKKDQNELFISEWLMSCRVLKRGMEEFIINKIINVAKANGFTKVIGEYIKSSKNEMVKDIYANLGFSKLKDNVYGVNTEEFVYNETYIRENNKNEQK